VAADAKIFNAQIRDAMVVRRAVTLGLPVTLIGQENSDPLRDNVVHDYHRLAEEIENHRS
jgi:chromosome partitioning protein